jgi:hypothetical protein
MLKSLLVALLTTTNALDAMLSVSPDTVSSPSTLSMMVSFDESIGKGGLLSVIVPDGALRIANSGFTANSNNKALQFKPGSGLKCTTDDSNVQIFSCQAGSNQIDIWMTESSFILAGQVVTFTIDMGCFNPSSLWYLESSMMIKTFNSQQQNIETRSDFLYLASLKPGPMTEVTLQYGS